MARHSKRYVAARKMVDAAKRYAVADAVALVKSMPRPKFNETVEIALRLGVDPKQADQLIRGSVSLPKGIGKEVRVIAFCEGAAAEAAKAAGALEAGGADLAKKIEDGWTDFDIAVADPGMMRHVGKLGRILGPQGKMPSPKSGTVTPDVGAAVKEFKGGRIEYRTDATGNVHAPVGRADFEAGDLTSNVEAFLAHIQAVRPASVKGQFILSAYLASTMGPSVRLAV